MSSEGGQIVLVLVVSLAAVFGVWRWYTEGRVRAGSGEQLPNLATGQTATLVQFSSKVCSPCNAARRLLTDLAGRDGVEHVDLDVEENMELVERYGITRTPTVLVLDAEGRVRHRIVGVPRRSDLEHALHGQVHIEEETA